MTEFSTPLSEANKNLGREFGISYYIPSLALLILQVILLSPLWVKHIFSALSKKYQSLLQLNLVSVGLFLIVFLLLPLIFGIILLSLNDIFIKIFEGKVWWLEKFILYPFYRFNKKRCLKLYGELTELRRAYYKITCDTYNIKPNDEKVNKDSIIGGLTQQIDEEHKRIEAIEPKQKLPHDIEMVTSTLFGNIYAIIEEYAYERYGIDSILFWPRLRELLTTLKPSLFSSIISQKVILDLDINFTVISSICIGESLILVRIGVLDNTFFFISLLIGIIACLMFYKASVRALENLGEFIKLSFDFHRHTLLHEFIKDIPSNLQEEQNLWIRLATFLNRGDEFYFPESTGK